MKKRLVELGKVHPAVVRDVRGTGLLLAIRAARDDSDYESETTCPAGQ